ncbi:LOW QUALITY PROTEIN: uncharacterized protein ACR2FA_012670 [Aphomia sociella]
MNALKLFVKNARSIRPSIRPMSATAGPLVNVSIDDEGIATLTMQRPPVNSLNLELIQEIDKGLDEVAKNKAKGLILTSSSSSVFSAGLDIMEMYKPEAKRVEQFWTSLQGLWLKLFGTNLITAAAINGHSPAGGCLLAMSCEYRVMMNGKFTIGLNETALGIIAPRWFMDSMCNTIPRRQAEFALTTGRLFTVEEALKVGLIDETSTDKEDTIEKCKQFINKFDMIPPLARGITKQRIRGDALEWLQKNRQADLKEFLSFVNSPKIQQSLEMYMQYLKQKSILPKSLNTRNNNFTLKIFLFFFLFTPQILNTPFYGIFVFRMNALRLYVRNAKNVHPIVRPMSSKTGSLVDISVDNEGIAILTMQRPPVNSLNLELIQDIVKGLDVVAKNKSKGLILTSSSASAFSAGLDITELYNPDVKRLEQLWSGLQDIWLKLYGSNFITAAAINGHSPAGGCLLAISCEYRVMMSGRFTIGLSESLLGIVIARWFIDTMYNTISRRTELALTTGKLFTVDEALKVGLIDETSTDKADTVEKCKQFIKKFDRIPLARGFTKQRIRGDALEWLRKNRQADLNDFMSVITSPNVQQSLEVYLQNLKQRSAKK